MDMGTITLVIDNPETASGDYKATPEQFDSICQDLLQVLIDLTPVDTGFCASQWSVDVGEASATFHNAAEYSSFLDDGWSDQAPTGMTGPALDVLPDIVSTYI